MKKILLLFLIPFCSYGQITSKVIRSGARMGYLEHLPSGYDKSSPTKYPVLIFLHGSGERGTGSLIDLEKVKVHGIGKQLAQGKNFEFDGQKFIVLCPQTNYFAGTNYKLELTEFLKYVHATYQDDSTRWYLTGLSMGGRGTWDGSQLPIDYFAAIVPVSATASAIDAKTLTAGRHIAVWALHGDADKQIAYTAGYSPIKAMLSIFATPIPIWTLQPGLGHNDAFWDKVYNTGIAYYNPNIYSWMLTKFKPGGF